jgi:hypothetical protein
MSPFEVIDMAGLLPNHVLVPLPISSRVCDDADAFAEHIRDFKAIIIRQMEQSNNKYQNRRRREELFEVGGVGSSQTGAFSCQLLQ